MCFRSIKDNSKNWISKKLINLEKIKYYDITEDTVKTTLLNVFI